MTLVMGYGSKKRTCDAESIHVDEEPPKIYFDPEDPTIRKYNFEQAKVITLR